jgi:hypothetical protein
VCSSGTSTAYAVAQVGDGGELRDQRCGKHLFSLPHTPPATFPSQSTQFMSVRRSFPRVPALGWLLGHGEGALGASVGPAALRGRVLGGACGDDRCSTTTARHVTVGVWIWIFFYVGSGLELKHIEKGKIVLPWDDLLHLRGGLTAGAFTGAIKVYGRCFYWGGQGARCARACEVRQTQRKLWRALLPSGCEFASLYRGRLHSGAPSLGTHRGARWGLYLI